MTLLVACERVSKRFGAHPLFSDLSIAIHAGDRVGMVGPNGAGKSTLIKILAGLETADQGTVSRRKGARLAFVPQERTFAAEDTPFSVLTSALNQRGLNADANLGTIHEVLGRAGIVDADQKVLSMSGGMRKRVAIGEALVLTPEILLMDEPTNHLDTSGIEWLEDLVKSSSFATVVISHDRWFLEVIATRMVEVNKAYAGGIFDVAGTYADFLVKKAEYLLAASRNAETMANKMRREEEWLRRGPAARTTKSSARIRSAEELRSTLSAMRERAGSARLSIDFQASGRKTKRLIEAKDLGVSLGDRSLFEKVNFTLGPGIRLGIAGRNGSGKSTLLRLLAGQMDPTTGSVTRADGLRLVWFDQQREQLDSSQTLRRILAPDSDGVVVGSGENARTVHVASWASRFGFSAGQLDVRAEKLSGGERARLLIARLILQPADILLLDEPTNDLDLNTVELLEESLLEFGGSVVLVTHDRFLLDRVSTVILTLDGTGEHEFLSGWAQVEQYLALSAAAADAKEVAERDRGSQKKDSKKLTYKDQREYDGMEAAIAALENEIATYADQLNLPEMATNSAKLAEVSALHAAAQERLDRMYERWAELEKKMK